MSNIQVLADNISDQLQAGLNISIIADPGTGQVASLYRGMRQLGLTGVVVTDMNFLELSIPVRTTDGTVVYSAWDGVMTADVFILDNVLAHPQGQAFLDKLQTGYISGLKLPKIPLIAVLDEIAVEGFTLL